MSQMIDPSDWRDALPGPTEELYEAVGRLRHALQGIMAATGDPLVEASAREWVITVLREEARTSSVRSGRPTRNTTTGRETVELAAFKTLPVIDAGWQGWDSHDQPSTHEDAAWKVTTWIDDQSAGLTVGLEGPLVGGNECLVAFAADGEADDVSVAVVGFDEGPDDDGECAFRGLHVRTVQGGCDLKDLHSHKVNPEIVVGAPERIHDRV